MKLVRERRDGGVFALNDFYFVIQCNADYRVTVLFYFLEYYTRGEEHIQSFWDGVIIIYLFDQGESRGHELRLKEKNRKRRSGRALKCSSETQF